MPFNVLTSFKSNVITSFDIETGRIVLRAQMRGTAVPTARETPERLRTSGLIPREASPFPDNVALLCTEVNVEQTQPLLIEWTADFEWRSPEPGGNGGGGVPQGFRISMQTVKGQHLIDQDIEGVPIMTVTRESFDPPPTDERSDLAYVLSTDNRPFNPDLLAMYIDSKNNDLFLGRHQPGSAKIDDVQGEVSVDSEGQEKMSVQLRIVVGRPPPARNLMERDGNQWKPITQDRYAYTWDKRIRAEGNYLLRQPTPADITKAVKYRALDSFGELTTKPVLHRTRKTSSDGVGSEITNENDAEWYTFKTKFGLPFQALLAAL